LQTDAAQVLKGIISSKKDLLMDDDRQASMNDADIAAIESFRLDVDDGESAQESSSEGSSNMASSSSGNSRNSAVRDAALTKMAYGGWKQQRDLSRQQKKMLHMQQVKADFGIT